MGKHYPVSTRQYIQGWLKLFRVPNLLTVPGDPLAGAALVWLLAPAGTEVPPGLMIWSAVCALCLYGAGLLLNDLHDLDADRIYRPSRPLPNRIVPVGHAVGATVILILGGLAAALAAGFHTLTMALILLVLIFSYTFLTKRMGSGIAVLNMGLCRGVSTLLAVDADNWTSWPGLLAVLTTLYTIGLTLVSRREERLSRIGGAAWIPAGVAAVQAALCLDFLIQRHHEGMVALFFGPAVLALAFALAEAVRLARRLTRRTAVEPEMTQQAVGRFIHILPLLQSWPLLINPLTFPAGLVLALCSPLAIRAGRRYAGS